MKCNGKRKKISQFIGLRFYINVKGSLVEDKRLRKIDQCIFNTSIINHRLSTVLISILTDGSKLLKN